jgi:hypothetical protein
MRLISFRIATAVAMIQVVFGCAVLEEWLPDSESPVIQNERASRALASLEKLGEIDAYIKLDNKLLGDHIRAELEAQAAATGKFEFTRLRVRFERQHIALEAVLLVTDGPGEPREAAVSGDVLLAFSGDQLIWLPHFNELIFRDNDFVFFGDREEPGPEALLSGLLEQINRDITDAVIVLGKNVVRINPVPLGSIEVGADLAGFIDVSASNSHALGGVFTVAGSTILIEPSITSIALDLEFIPSISTCPADIHVSRSTFANEIRAREPIGIARLVDDLGEMRYFFTEISGASRSTAVVHYWFADGKPVAVEELPVEPSFRWRTWSSKTIDRTAGNWEVIVVEKSTGCILHSLALRTDIQGEATAATETSPASSTFAQLLNEFEGRVAEFSILEDKPEVALVEVPRDFLSEVLHASLKDIHINVDFDISGRASRQVSGVLQPLAAGNIVCTERECSARRECTTGFTQCARRRDTRDCNTCLFRNPLNGRCVNEGVDPICEAARTIRNNRYAAEMELCLNREATAKSDCESLRSQEIRSCKIEAATEKSACEAGREVVEVNADAAAYATVSGQVRTTGGLRAIYSSFELGEDLSDLRLNLGFSAALDLEGTVSFNPRSGLGQLGTCIAAWKGLYRAKVVMPLAASSMIGSVETDGAALVTNWSGYVLSAAVTPSPLQAIFVEHPGLLADCQIGLTVDRVAGALVGEDGGYFGGGIGFEIQPLPSRIQLEPATLEYGERTYGSMPVLSGKHLRFELEEP